jgi:hypothetical protein
MFTTLSSYHNNLIKMLSPLLGVLGSISLFKIFSRAIAMFLAIWLVGMLILAMLGSVSFNQHLDASFGLMRRNTTVAEVKMQKSFVDKVLSGQMSNAFGAVSAKAIPVEILNWDIALKTSQILTSALMNIAYQAIIQPIMKIANQIFKLVDNILNMLEQIAQTIGGTRIAMGYKIYADVEGFTGKGTSNFQGSNAFVKNLLDATSKAGTSNFYNSAFPKKQEMALVLADAVAWLDFMNIQRSLQSNIIGDFLTGFLGLESSKFDDVKGQIVDAVLGSNCEQSDLIHTVPVFKQFAGKFNSCKAENAGLITGLLDNRARQIVAVTQSKLQQYQLKPPADCKYGQYYDAQDNSRLDYDVNNPGNLGEKIAEFSKSIELKEISAEECEGVKTMKSEQSKNLANQTTATNIDSIAKNPGMLINTLISQVTQTFQNLFDSILKKITDRFNRAMALIRNIKLGVLYIPMLDIAFNIRRSIREKLDGLNNEYQDYRKNVTNTKDLNLSDEMYKYRGAPDA